MTIETSVAALTTSTTALINAVGTQQITVENAVASFNNVIQRVYTELNLVNNTPDLNKPVSILTKELIDTKQASLISGVNISTVNGFSLLGGEPLVIVRSATSLNRVLYDDRGTLRFLTPQVDDSTVVESLGLFMWTNSQVEPDDDETCFTTSDGQWLLQAPAWDLINAWSLHETSISDDWREDEPNRFASYLINNK